MSKATTNLYRLQKLGIKTRAKTAQEIANSIMWAQNFKEKYGDLISEPRIIKVAGATWEEIRNDKIKYNSI